MPVNGSWHASERKNTLIKSVSPVMLPALGIYLHTTASADYVVFGEMLAISRLSLVIHTNPLVEAMKQAVFPPLGVRAEPLKGGCGNAPNHSHRVGLR